MNGNENIGSEKADCLVAFGANQGDLQRTFDQTLQLLCDSEQLDDVQASAAIITAPVGGPSDQAPYVNACFRFQTELSPSELFGLLVGIENGLGRLRRQRWGSRKIDLDLLLYGTVVSRDGASQLEIPHPRMTFRRFVLEPAAQIAADMVHPIAEMSLGNLLAHILEHEERIRFVCDRTNEALLVRLKAFCQGFGWELMHSSVQEIGENQTDSFRLNVYLESESTLIEPIVSGLGPLLKLRSEDWDDIATELSAAIATLTTC